MNPLTCAQLCVKTKHASSQSKTQDRGVALRHFGEVQSGEWAGYAETLAERVLISRRSRA
jgi:hypothetical protein